MRYPLAAAAQGERFCAAKGVNPSLKNAPAERRGVFFAVLELLQRGPYKGGVRQKRKKAPFGWHLISDGQARIHVDLIASVGFWVFLGFAKGVLSFFVGVPALFIQLSEVLRAKTELDAMAVQK